jgi:cellulose synthase/poly-beta-1,6-N-acetylglucosamine synthase-like glycosyltransferase
LKLSIKPDASVFLDHNLQIILKIMETLGYLIRKGAIPLLEKEINHKEVKFSVIVPAHNEQNYIAKCLNSIEEAANKHFYPIETIVVLNRCTDKTEEIARSHKAIIKKEDSKNLARIRNMGVRASQGEFIMTIDADSWISSNMFHVICLILVLFLF